MPFILQSESGVELNLNIFLSAINVTKQMLRKLIKCFIHFELQFSFILILSANDLSFSLMIRCLNSIQLSPQSVLLLCFSCHNWLSQIIVQKQIWIDSEIKIIIGLTKIRCSEWDSPKAWIDGWIRSDQHYG